VVATKFSRRPRTFATVLELLDLQGLLEALRQMVEQGGVADDQGGSCGLSLDWISVRVRSLQKAITGRCRVRSCPSACQSCTNLFRDRVQIHQDEHGFRLFGNRDQHGGVGVVWSGNANPEGGSQVGCRAAVSRTRRAPKVASCVQIGAEIRQMQTGRGSLAFLQQIPVGGQREERQLLRYISYLR